jgi:hypothetical protein
LLLSSVLAALLLSGYFRLQLRTLQVVLVEGLARRQKGPNGAGWYQRAQTIAAQAQAAFAAAAGAGAAAAATAGEGEGASPPEVCCHSPECEGWGVHHTKAFVLAYADGGVRILVHTANLLFGDCNSQTQGLWWQVSQQQLSLVKV